MSHQRPEEPGKKTTLELGWLVPASEGASRAEVTGTDEDREMGQRPGWSTWTLAAELVFN